MPVLNVRNLPPEVHARLRLRAARNGRSMEAEARAILEAAVGTEATAPDLLSLPDWIDQVYGPRKPGACGWSAVANVAWLHTASSGSGNGTVNYTVDANGSTSARTGTLTVGDGLMSGSCGTNACHNSGTSITTATPNVAVYSWNTTQGDCTLCHRDGSSMATNAHDEHLRFGTAPCAYCHAGATAGTHINQSVNFNAGNVTHSRGAAVAIGGTPERDEHDDAVSQQRDGGLGGLEHDDAAGLRRLPLLRRDADGLGEHGALQPRWSSAAGPPRPSRRRRRWPSPGCPSPTSCPAPTGSRPPR